MELSQVRLLVTDFNASYRFYRDVIGLTPLFGGEGDVYADFRITDAITLAIFGRGDMAAAIGNTALPARAEAQDPVLLTFAVDDLPAAIQKLGEQGVELVAPPTDRPEWGMRTAHFRDPDGNLVEIFVQIPMSQG
jgi:catechol 2,3-dioxygenase-like lactoylglutathione lyase family enzyme